MGKSKVQSLVPLISRCQIIEFLILSHCIPFPVPILISLHIVDFRSQIPKNIENQDRKKNAIATLVSRSVVFSVDIGSDDARGLNTHVVERS